MQPLLLHPPSLVQPPPLPAACCPVSSAGRLEALLPVHHGYSDLTNIDKTTAYSMTLLYHQSVVKEKVFNARIEKTIAVNFASFWENNNCTISILSPKKNKKHKKNHLNTKTCLNENSHQRTEARLRQNTHKTETSPKRKNFLKAAWPVLWP